MKKCPKGCDGVFFAEDKFCYLCSNKLTKEQVCSCGRLLADVHKFCPKCGKEVRGENEES